MSDWWEDPYAGGPMVKVKGFPRPLYPPDAKQCGKKPSMDGPDVLAYKRTICRAGRWGDWDPSSWDDSYSNGFAHGKSGNVKDTGVAGVQRQQHIDATGWLGEKTFNALRSIRVPDGPHEGEMAMDAYAADLIDQAFAKFGGHEPDETTGTVRQAALARAQTQIGYVEGANNANKYGDWYGMNHQPYCAIFATWAFETNDKAQSPSFAKGSRYSYVPYIVADARGKKNGLKVIGVEDAIPGDLVCYDWAWDGEFDHVGLLEKFTGGGAMNVIEGNTSPDNQGSQSNGGGVYRRNRLWSTQSTVFVRVNEP